MPRFALGVLLSLVALAFAPPPGAAKEEPAIELELEFREISRGQESVQDGRLWIAGRKLRIERASRTRSTEENILIFRGDRDTFFAIDAAKRGNHIGKARITRSIRLDIGDQRRAVGHAKAAERGGGGGGIADPFQVLNIAICDK